MLTRTVVLGLVATLVLALALPICGQAANSMACSGMDRMASVGCHKIAAASLDCCFWEIEPNSPSREGIEPITLELGDSSPGVGSGVALAPPSQAPPDANVRPPSPPPYLVFSSLLL